MYDTEGHADRARPEALWKTSIFSARSSYIPQLRSKNPARPKDERNPQGDAALQEYFLYRAGGESLSDELRLSLNRWYEQQEDALVIYGLPDYEKIFCDEETGEQREQDRVELDEYEEKVLG